MVRRLRVAKPRICEALPPDYCDEFKRVMDESVAAIVGVSVKQIASNSYCDRLHGELRYSIEFLWTAGCASIVNVQDRVERIATNVTADVLRKFSESKIPSWQWTKLPCAHVAFPRVWGNRANAYMKLVASIEE